MHTTMPPTGDRPGRARPPWPGRLGLWLALATVTTTAGIGVADEVDFERQVAPILLGQCLECHSETSRSGGLDLTARAGLLKGGDSGPAIEPGHADESLLLERIDDGEMPPPKQGHSRALAEADRAVLRGWVDAGASWPEGRVLDLFAVTTAGHGGRDWWSLRPIQAAQAPAVRHPEWVANPVDAFVVAGLESQGWEPAPMADARTLIRRLYDDLLGLVPDREEVEAFAADDRPDAYERLVDRLLASPHYGERWGRHWLDVARYAETSGYERDQEKPHVWKYRDWVIAAFNADLPYDRFITEQLAGDERPGADAASLTATGFLRLGTWNDEPNDPEEYKYERLEDLVHVTSTAFLGLTIKCARCHDHKFDPIRQTDYYRVASAFWAGPIEPGAREHLGGPDPKTLPAEVLAWTDVAREPAPLHLLIKGDPARRGPVVAPAPPSFLPALDRPLDPPAAGASTSQRRLQLARWIVDPANPIAARVWANRVWQHHFGQGLVRSPDNFGFTGDRPTHPELLDWLADRLVAEGWSTKALHRTLLRSRTYRQASLHPRQDEYAAVDAGNRLWWHAERRRRDAESVRDALLAAGGQLDRSRMGGPSIRPEIAPDALEGLSMKGGAWTPSPPDQQGRRSVYLHSKRGLLPPLLTTFDFMDTTLPCGQRDVTLVAPQALALLNNPFVHEQSRRLARRVIDRGGDAEAQIGQAWRLALGRDPSDAERAAAREHLASQRALYAGALAREDRTDVPLPAGVALHLRADAGVTLDDAGRVAAWADQSGRGRDARQEATGARPRLVREPGAPARLRFDAPGQFLTLAGAVLERPHFSVVAVAADPGGDTHRTLFSNWNGGAGNSTTSVFFGTTGAGVVRLSDDFTTAAALPGPGALQVIGAVAGPEQTAVYRGAEVLSERSTPLTPRNLAPPYVIGQQGNIGGEWWRGDLAELLVFDRPLDRDEVRCLARHLARRHLLDAGTDPVADDPDALALASLCHVLLNSSEFLYVD